MSWTVLFYRLSIINRILWRAFFIRLRALLSFREARRIYFIIALNLLIWRIFTFFHFHFFSFVFSIFTSHCACPLAYSFALLNERISDDGCGELFYFDFHSKPLTIKWCEWMAKNWKCWMGKKEHKKRKTVKDLRWVIYMRSNEWTEKSGKINVSGI